MKALVTGGGGFLGGAIVRMLLDQGHVVRSISRQTYGALAKLGVEQHAGDIGDIDAVSRAVRGVDLVFHVAGKAGYWGSYRDYYHANVIGTRNVIAACRAHDVRKIVYTSSPSVVHTGEDLEGVDESTPYPGHYEAPYPATKAIAERDMLRANSPDLATVALRPHLIWGPGDNHLVPRLIERARKGHLRIIGTGTKRVDVTYIDNAAHAHLLAASRLEPGSAISGHAYFISQGEPVETAAFINRILAAAGLPPLMKRMNYSLAYALAFCLEGFWRVAGIESEPRLSRFLVRQFATAHWFNISAARRDLGYEPIVSIEEGLKLLKAG